MNSNPPLGFLPHDVARLLRKRFEQRAKCLGLTSSQWQALAYLSNNEGIHQGGLAEMLEIEPITLVRILDKLSERERLLPILSQMKTNLVQACRTPLALAENETNHG